jgi:hypothetical protein
MISLRPASWRFPAARAWSARVIMPIAPTWRHRPSTGADAGATLVDNWPYADASAGVRRQNIPTSGTRAGDDTLRGGHRENGCGAILNVPL